MGSFEGTAANQWRRAQNARQAYSAEQMQWDARSASRLGIGNVHTKPSGLGVQIDAMIQRLKDDGHSPANIARVMRLRADKLEKPE